MRFLAHHDALTGLPNRTLLTDRLLRGIALAKRNNNKLAVIFLDLNDFKKINDTLGHHAGDQLLQIVAQRLSNCVRESDTVGRLGGDEFVVLVGAIDKHADVLVVAEKIVASLAQPMTIEGRMVQGIDQHRHQPVPGPRRPPGAAAQEFRRGDVSSQGQRPEQFPLLRFRPPEPADNCCRRFRIGSAHGPSIQLIQTPVNVKKRINKGLAAVFNYNATNSCGSFVVRSRAPRRPSIGYLGLTS